jgi:hypothetical protein
MRYSVGVLLVDFLNRLPSLPWLKGSDAKINKLASAPHVTSPGLFSGAPLQFGQASRIKITRHRGTIVLSPTWDVVTSDYMRRKRVNWVELKSERALEELSFFTHAQMPR